MTTHVIASTPAPAAPEGAWLRLSAALTAHAETLTGRTDLTVTCAPGAGHGVPGCFIRALATIELDGTHLGHNPATCDPRRPSDRERYPVLWGVFLHESAHVRHSHWHAHIAAPAPTANASAIGTASGTATTAHAEAATLLEESRIEAAHLRTRPADRRWLRASARQLILTGFTTPTAATGVTGMAAVPQVAMTPWEAAHAAALLLARVDAGVLEAEETKTLKATVTDVLGASRLSALSALWHLAHATADNDHQAMLELGRRWCTTLGTPPEDPPPTHEEQPESGGESSRPSPLTEAITAALTAVADTDAPPAPPTSAGPSRANQRADERDARRRATQAARRVFAPSADEDSGPTAITDTRAPTREEQAAARQLARHLKAAAHRERIPTTTTSATPPGRLRMRGALAADAQRAAGATPTAEPFTRTTRRHTPAPPLRLGIACDVSGSMRELAAPIASAAWILARAASHVPDARSATVIFGSRVRPVTYPGQTPARVRQFSATDSYERFCEAVDALEAAVDLTRPDAARLLVIVSDGKFRPDQLTGGAERITRLMRHGCGVLWLALGVARPLNGAHLITLTNPADAANIIGQAATRALHTI